MDTIEAQATLVGILRDDLDACDERDQVFSFGSFRDMYDEIDWVWVWWWIETFVTDVEHRRKLAAMIRAPDQFFADLAKLEHARTGQAVRIPRRLVRGLRLRLLQAAYPTLNEIVLEAQRAPAARASANIQRKIEVEKWRTRFSS